MPTEGSDAHTGRSLGIDLDNCIQGKSFTRSVSISESSSVGSAPAHSVAAASHGVLPVFPPLGRFASGGSEISPSPFSSTGATISPESPLPSAVTAAYGLFPPQFNAGSRQPETNMAAQSPSPVIPTNPTESLPSTCLSCSQPVIGAGTNNSAAVTEIGSVSEFTSLLQQPATRRTVTLLSHLLDSRLPADWRDALMSKSGPLRSASPYDTERSSAGNTTESSSVDVPDGLQRPGSVLSPFECGAVKRFKPDDHETDSGHRDFQLSKTCSEPTPTLSHLNDRRPSVQSDVSSAHTLARLAKCVCRLADHFETRYHDRLGSLLDDVAHLSTSCKDESVATEADGSPSKQSPASDSTQPAVSSDVANENQSRIVACPEDVELLSARNRFHTVLTELFSERINWGRIIAMLAFVRALCEWVERTRLSRKSRSTATGSLVTQQDTVSETEAEAPTDTSLVRHRSTTGSPGIQSPNAGDHEQLTSSESEAVAPSVTSCSQQSTSNGDEFHAQRLRAAHYVAWTAEFIHDSHGIWDWIAANGGWEGLFEFEADKGIYTSHEDEPVVIGLTEDDAMRILRRAVTGVATLVVGAAGLVAALRFFSRRL